MTRDDIKNAVAGVEVAVIMQAVITCLLTIAVITLIIIGRSVPDIIQSAWLICIGLWLPLPSKG